MTGLVWVRLVDGRLWHIDESRLETVCGAAIRTEEPKQPELIDEHTPRGAWICTRCVAELRRRADQAHWIARADPRRRADPGIHPEATVLPDPSRPTPAGGPIDLVGALQASVAAAQARRTQPTIEEDPHA